MTSSKQRGAAKRNAGSLNATGEVDMIRKVKEGYRVVAESGRNMGTYATKAEAERRLRQVEFFKRQKKPKKG